MIILRLELTPPVTRKQTTGMAEKNVPQWIKAIRTRMGLTQEQFAAVIGVTFATVNRWEAGKTNPSRLALMRLDEIQRNRRKGAKAK